MPKTSVVVIAYNHEKYISKAIESALMQKGDFSLEVIIGDDFSTDKTGLIIQKYKTRFPNLIRVMSSTKNAGLTQNLKRCLKECTGEYIAICEGDDYWTDPYKIRNQVEFLAERPECAFCFNALMLKFETVGEFQLHSSQAKLMKGKDMFNTQELIADNFIGNFSCCMYRKSVVEKIPDNLYDISVADWMYNIVCSEYGMIGFLKTPMSVYRIHKSGIWSGKSREEQYLSWIRHIETYDKFLNFKYHDDFKNLRKKNTFKPGSSKK